MAYFHHHGAAAPSASPPLKKEAPTVRPAGLQESARGRAGNGADSDQIRCYLQARKRLATAKARAALLGVALVESVDGRGSTIYLVCRWSYSTERASLDEVEQLLQRMEGRQ